MTDRTRVYVDMVGDLFHPGHVALLRAARSLGDELLVGVLSDETVAAYKRRPILTLAERVVVIESCRYVDVVIADAPARLTGEFLREHDVDLVVHGDWLSSARSQRGSPTSTVATDRYRSRGLDGLTKASEHLGWVPRTNEGVS